MVMDLHHDLCYKSLQTQTQTAWCGLLFAYVSVGTRERILVSLPGVLPPPARAIAYGYGSHTSYACVEG